MTESPASSIVVISRHPGRREQAGRLASHLGASLLTNADPAALREPDFALVLDEASVYLQQTGRKAPGPIQADFASGAVDHRRRFGGGKGQMIARAVGLAAHVKPRVLDLTAGLGGDAFVLASLGCEVSMVERSPVVQALLEDGLERAAAVDDPELAAIVARMTLRGLDAAEYLRQPGEAPEVVYLDPMFPPRKKSADVKKEMRAFHSIVGADEDAGELLTLAREKAVYRVVVKRPRKAPDLGGQAPSHRLEGKTSRYDVYTNRALPAALHDS